MFSHVCPQDHRHGITCYKAHGCRCAQCKSANAQASRRYWAARRERQVDPMGVDLAVDGMHVYLTQSQREEAVRVLWRRRWSDRAIADRLGITDRTVLRIRHRIGLEAWAKHAQQRQLRAA